MSATADRGDRGLPGHQCPTGAGVRGVHRGAAPVALLGPEGFTTTTRAFEFRVGGEWDFVMHGPDGTDYQEWISWTEIVPRERIEGGQQTLSKLAAYVTEIVCE